MSKVQNVFLVGAKSLGAYGGYETFVYKLTEYHQNNPNIKYHVACKANGDGCMDETKLDNVKRISDSEFEFHNARCFKIHIPQIGPAQAIYYDVAALRECCKYIKKNNMPIEELMRTAKPDFPFCVGWANHDWSNKTWQKTKRFTKDTVFLKQEYLGKQDYTDYFYYLLPMFRDHRYIKVDEKPLFYVFDPDSCPDMKEFIQLWQHLAEKNGIPGIHFVARADSIGKADEIYKKNFMNEVKARYDRYIDMGFDAVSSMNFRRAEILATGFFKKIIRNIRRKIFGYALNSHDYMKLTEHYYTDEDKLDYVYPQITPRKDKTPRAGKNALVYTGSTPEKFRIAIKMALEKIKDKDDEHKILFLNSWNEWGEGSYD